MPAPPTQNHPGALARLAPTPRAASRWLPVPWAQLPGASQDMLGEAWSAWLLNCERPHSAVAALCGEVRRLSIGSEAEQRAFMYARFQPYALETASGVPGEGLLTGYYEPVFRGSRVRSGEFNVPLWAPPSSLATRKPWYTREQMDRLPAAQAELAGLEVVFLSDPVDALVLQIQGSGRVQVMERDGNLRTVRMAYAATNGQPYKSVGRWLLDQGLIRDASWPGIKAWTQANPGRVQEMLWANPRMVFVREEALHASGAQGPRGAQGVPLSAGRSVAVDPQSVPYGLPLWLATTGPTLNMARMVFAQDTGSAIVGAVRADFYVGTGEAAGDIAGRLKQPMQMWVLWPNDVPLP